MIDIFDTGRDLVNGLVMAYALLAGLLLAALVLLGLLAWIVRSTVRAVVAHRERERTERVRVPDPMTPRLGH